MMIVIRVDVPKQHTKGIKIKDVIGVTEDGTHWKLRILNAYLDTRGQPSVSIMKKGARSR